MYSGLPCLLSCTCVDSNLDPFRPLLLKCVNVEKTHVESTDFIFWFNICWFRRVKIVSIRCWCCSCSNSLSRSVRAFHNSNIQSNPCYCPCPYLLSLLSLLPFAFALAVPCLPLSLPTHQCPLGRLLLGVTNLSVSRFVLRGLYTHSMCLFLLSRHHTNSVSHGSTANVSRDHPATRLQGNSCGRLPQDCARFLGHLVDHSSISRDLPSFRWHPSTQAASHAMATKSPSRDFVLVPLCAGPTFCATCASSRSHGHLLLTSQRRSSDRPWRLTAPWRVFRLSL